jgi:F-type H+-transporting ATPase subunit delta
MAEATSLARPYAKAVFELAQEKGAFNDWSERLQALAQVTENETVRQAIATPSVDKKQLVDAILAAAGSEDEETRNLVALLAENGRLTAVSEMAEQFDALRAEAEKITQAEVVSATELSDSQRDAIAARLKEKLGTEVTLTTSIDESLIGGAIVRAGDLVIDGSVRAKLERLASSLTH